MRTVPIRGTQNQVKMAFGAKSVKIKVDFANFGVFKVWRAERKHQTASIKIRVILPQRDYSCLVNTEKQD